ncbi:hypothetical protein PM082_016387 [Marasmius tenuissimus]|nr:hypothetical protein PM082_016387 [Marasmius tenuissimus]
MSWVRFDLDLRDPYSSGDAFWMIGIFSGIGGMKSLEKLGLAMDEVPDGRPWTQYIPTLVRVESRWNWLQEVELDASSSVALTVIAICPLLLSASLMLRYEEVATNRMIVTGSLRRLQLTAMEGEAKRVFKAVTSPALERLVVDIRMSKRLDEDSVRLIVNAILGYVSRTDGRLEGQVWVPGASATELEELSL